MLIPALIAALLVPAANADEVTALVERVRPSVVTLQTRDVLGRPAGNGTGFFISADGLVATNHHVIATGPSVAVLHDGTTRAVRGLLASDPVADVAILAVEGADHPALPLGAPTPPAVRDPVLVIGSPQGLDQTVTEGMISALRPDGLPPEAQEPEVARTSLLQITAAIAPGSSGSPVLTPTGHVLGVAQSGNPLTATYFAVDIAAVQALLASAPADRALTPLDSPARQLAQTLALLGGLVVVAVTPGLFRVARERMRARARRRRRTGEQPPARFPGG